MANRTYLHNVTLPEPVIDGLLPDVPGGDSNLLPETLTHEDLKVWFTPPQYSDPTLDKETVELFVDYVDDTSVPICVREWTTPIQAPDQFVWLPRAWLANERNQGQHRLSYRFTVYNNEHDQSNDLLITLDITAPVLPSANKVVFPPAVLPPNTLTARYLDQNDDQVRADLPPYASPRPWDRITWYWGPNPGGTDLGGVIELDDKNHADPIVITLPGDFIRAKGDGLRYVWYEVHDRAGNPSRPSLAVELDVAATPIPRRLPWPTIEKALGSAEQQILDPWLATAGIVVEVPLEAVIYPEEQVFVQWGEPGTLGAQRVERPIVTGQRRYQIDMKSVAAHIGKTLWVSYGVIDEKGVEHPSSRRRLQVQTIAPNRLEALRCAGVAGSNLSYSSVGAQGAQLTLAKWSLITTDQWVKITMTGVGVSGDLVFPAVAGRAITDREVVGGIGFSGDVKVTKAFLGSLRRNQSLTGKVYVSFDGGQTWPPLSAPNFPLLQLTLID
jgi:hypothetical protein